MRNGKLFNVKEWGGKEVGGGKDHSSAPFSSKCLFCPVCRLALVCVWASEFASIIICVIICEVNIEKKEKRETKIEKKRKSKCRRKNRHQSVRVVGRQAGVCHFPAKKGEKRQTRAEGWHLAGKKMRTAELSRNMASHLNRLSTSPWSSLADVHRCTVQKHTQTHTWQAILIPFFCFCQLAFFGDQSGESYSRTIALSAAVSRLAEGGGHCCCLPLLSPEEVSPIHRLHQHQQFPLMQSSLKVKNHRNFKF